jgi:CheY-like chemotaxis protein
VNQRLAATLLERRGHRVTIAGNGKEALAVLEQQSVDVVLMDVQMPEMGGFEATAAIRALEHETGMHLPIIAMTAHAMKGDRERCLGAGMDEYITKPLESKLLCRTVERVVAGSAVGPESSAGGGPSDALLERLGGDARLLADISQLFIDDAPRYLREIQTALNTRDHDALRAAAHGLKGAAANFETGPVVEAARSLEEMGRQAALDNADDAWKALNAAMEEMVVKLNGYIVVQPST